MCQVMRFTLGEGPMSVCDYPIFPILFLVQDITPPNGTCIGMQLEGFGKASKGQDWGRGTQTLQPIKGFLAFIHPLNFLFLISYIITGNLIIEGASDFSMMLDESSVVVCEPQELLSSVTMMGTGQFLISLTLQPSVWMPSLEIMCPK